MRTRKLHAIAACAIFFGIAKIYQSWTGLALEDFRILFWSIAGVANYIALSQIFGFDPQRTRLTAFAPALLHYIDRWELRLGQATLGMLGCMFIAAKLLDAAHFVTAVVVGTLSAWTYFALRLYAGGYKARRNAGRP